jgi:hypothetical protein
MADKTLVWSVKRCDGNPTTMLPAYYIESEYEPIAVRIYAETAPIMDATFEIYDDGVSIMNDNAYKYSTYIANSPAYQGTYYFILPKGANSDEMAEDFNANNLDIGSWVTCSILNDGGAKNITVQLDLNRISESGEESD